MVDPLFILGLVVVITACLWWARPKMPKAIGAPE